MNTESGMSIAALTDSTRQPICVKACSYAACCLRASARSIGTRAKCVSSQLASEFGTGRVNARGTRLVEPLPLGLSNATRPQWPPASPASALTMSPSTPFASPNTISVLSAEYNSLSMPANPGFIDRLMAMHALARSASMIGMP
jgi:hypothetical protein